MVARGATQTSPSRLVSAPMRVDQVKAGLFVIRGPFDPVRARRLQTMNERMRDLARRKVPDNQLAEQLKLDDTGWAHTVSTGTFMRSIVRYRDEIAAAR